MLFVSQADGAREGLTVFRLGFGVHPLSRREGKRTTSCAALVCAACRFLIQETFRRKLRIKWQLVLKGWLWRQCSARERQVIVSSAWH